MLTHKPLLAVLLALLSLAGVVAAAAAPYKDAVARFAAGSYGQTEAAIEGVAASGGPLAGEVIEALKAGRLFLRGKTVLFRDGKGSLHDAATGALTSAPEGELKPVRVNNRIRRAVDAAGGALSIRSPDPAKRLSSARALFHSRDAQALPAIESALKTEAEPTVGRALEEARAAIVLLSAKASQKTKAEAVEILRRRGDGDALPILRGVGPDAPETVRTRAAEAVKSIEQWAGVLQAVQNLTYGVSLGSVLLLAAIGLAITFGVMGVINMAHGEMVMLGAYTTFVVQETIRAGFPGLFDASLFIAVPLAFLVAGAVGVLIERSVIRFLYGRPLETLLATWGISLILQQAVRTYFGPNNRQVGTPSWMSGALDLGGVGLTWNRIVIIGFALAVFFALRLALDRTAFGLQVSAVTQNRRMAAAMGIRTDRIDALTFGLGSGLAGIAGVALSQIDNVSPNLGQSYIIDSFLVVVFGGVGNLLGTLVGAMTLGVANKALEPFAGAVLGKILLLVAIILFIQKRPRGLFALKGRFVQA